MALMLIKTCCSLLPCRDKIQEYVDSTQPLPSQASGDAPAAPSSQDFMRLRQLIADTGPTFRSVGISPESAVSVFKAALNASSVLWNCLYNGQSSSPAGVLETLYPHMKILVSALRKFE